jgi:hypothetical protein
MHVKQGDAGKSVRFAGVSVDDWRRLNRRSRDYGQYQTGPAAMQPYTLQPIGR